MAKRKMQVRKQLTARPARAGDKLQGTQGVDAGLSVAPEDLGLQFLRTATEQGNFESSDGSGAAELSITDGAPTDDALPEPAFESGRSLWESTVDLALESSADDTSNDEASASSDSAPDADEVDLGAEQVREASLFDSEAALLGEVTEPKTATENSGHHVRHPKHPLPPIHRATR